MAELIHIKKVVVGPRNLDATIQLSDDAPRMTSDDAIGTRRVVDLLPGVEKHACLGDTAPQFGDVVSDTEVAHLLEHVAVELLALTNRAGDITSGRTTTLDEKLGLFEVSLVCPDDVLVAGALSSAAWILNWAYADGEDPKPNIEAITQGLVALVKSVDGEDEDASEEDLSEESQSSSVLTGEEDGSFEGSERDEVAEEFAEGELVDEAAYEASGEHDYDVEDVEDASYNEANPNESTRATFYDDQYREVSSDAEDGTVDDDWYDDEQSDSPVEGADDQSFDETYDHPYVEEDEDAGTTDATDAAASDAEDDSASAEHVDDADSHKGTSFDDNLPDDWSMINVPRPRPVR